MAVDLSIGDPVDGKTTDDDPSTTTPTEAQWQRLERDIEDLCRDAARDDRPPTVQRDIRLPGILSGTQRQVDVFIEGTQARIPLRIAVECKHYKHRVDIKTLESFIGMLLDLDVDKGVMYALNGYTAPAKARAEGQKHPAVMLVDVDVARLESLDYSAVLDEVDCPNPACYAEVYRWRTFAAEPGDELEIGTCDSCSTDAIRCYVCGDLIAVMLDEDECWCGAQYEITRTRDSYEIEYVLGRWREEAYDFARPLYDYDSQLDDGVGDGVVVTHRFRDA